MSARMPSSSSMQFAVGRLLLSYLLKHPDAKDTVEGIARWWLARERMEQGIEEVRAALRVLVNTGLLVERQGIEGRSYYSVNMEKKGEIRAMLDAMHEER